MSDKKEVVAQSAYMIGNATKEEALRGSCSNADESSPLLGDSGASRSGRGKPSTSEHERIWATALASIVAVIPMLLAGFTIGYPSAAVLQLQDLGGARHFSDSLIAMFGAFASVGAMLGGPLAGLITDRWGRKTALLGVGVPYSLGYLLIIVAQEVEDGDGFKALILMGRIITGLGMGWSCGVCPVYIAEISSARRRGFFGSLVELALSIGVLIVFAVSSINAMQYYHTAVVAIGIVLAFEIMMVWLYESPRYLYRNGQKQKGIRVLEWLRGPNFSCIHEIKEIDDSCSNKQPSMLEVLHSFTKRSLFIPLVLLLLVMFFQQIGGLNAMSSYAAHIFKQAGIKDPQLTATYSIGITMTVATAIVVLIVDRIGRKTLLIVSGIGMTIGTVLLGTDFYITRPSLCVNVTDTALDIPVSLGDTLDVVCNPQYNPVAITGVIVYNIAFAFGWGPVPFILVAEFLPLQVRGVASGLSAFVNWGASSLVVGLYIEYAAAVELWFAWWSFSVLNILSVILAVFFIPETKGKSLEELQRRFEGKSSIVIK